MTKLECDIEFANREIEELQRKIDGLNHFVGKLQYNINSGVNMEAKLTSFKDFPDSKKLRNIRAKYGVDTVEQLLYLSAEDILSVKGAGEKELCAIDRWLRDMNLSRLV